KTKIFTSRQIRGVDGCALGSGTLAGYAFANTNPGTVVRINLATGDTTLIASGGDRGDFVSVDPDSGSLLLTQTSTIVRLVPPAGGCFGASFTISASAGEHGVIRPNGEVSVACGGDTTF